MAKITTLTDLAANTEADAFAKLLDGGFIDIYGGEQPDTADAPVSGQRRAVSLALGSPAFGAAAAGVIIAREISPGTAEYDVNPVTWARVYRSDHKTAVMDVSVGTKDATILLPTVNLPRGITVNCGFFSHTIEKR